MVMGCYGIGVTRTLQSIIEQSHDENGIIWPVTVAPYQVALLPLNMQHGASVNVADQLEKELQHADLPAFYDDRDERPGVKFKDADLLGFPVRVVVSERSLAQGQVEIKRRTEKEKTMVPVTDAVQYLRKLLS